VHSPESNGIAEAFVKTFKRDYARIHPLPDAAAVLRQIARWFDDYNESHPHSGLGMISPQGVHSGSSHLAGCPVLKNHFIIYHITVNIVPVEGEGVMFVADDPSLDQFVPAWAKELAGGSSSLRWQWEDWLWYKLGKDIGNGLLDNIGAAGSGCHSGVRVIMPGGQLQCIHGCTLSGAVRELGHCIVLSKEAVLAFAGHHRRPPPSWYFRREESKPVPLATGTTESQPSPSPEELQRVPTSTYTRGSQPRRSSEELTLASQAQIIEAIRSEYANAKAAGSKPHNVKELSAALQPLLQRKGFSRSLKKSADKSERI
jgi:hypothetical protein